MISCVQYTGDIIWFRLFSHAFGTSFSRNFYRIYTGKVKTPLKVIGRSIHGFACDDRKFFFFFFGCFIKIRKYFNCLIIMF